MADSLPSSEDKNMNYGDFVSSYKSIFNEKCASQLTNEQTKLIADMITLQDKQVMRMFSDYRNHGDVSRLLEDIKVVIPVHMKADPFKEAVSSLIRPNKVPVESANQSPKEDHSPGDGGPSLGSRNPRIEDFREEMDLRISTLPAISALESPTDHESEIKEPTFKEALLTYVLRKEGIHELFVSKFISRLDSCEKRDFGANEALIEDLIDYAKSRLTSILYNDFGLKDISTILQNPELFMECFMKTNRVNQDQKDFLRAELKDCLAKLEADEGVLAKEDDQDDLLVGNSYAGRPCFLKQCQ